MFRESQNSVRTHFHRLHFLLRGVTLDCGSVGACGSSLKEFVHSDLGFRALVWVQGLWILGSRVFGV